MAKLALAVVGAGIGLATGLAGGAAAGWLVGSLIGNALFAKGSKTEGPRLGDLTIQSATEGAPIAMAYGTGRLAGNLIWSPGIVEIKTKKKTGGKGLGGKSSSTTYTYQASFAVGLADRSTDAPIQGVRKIWADGKLIYSASATASAATIYSSRKKLTSIAMYPGSSTQIADPTIQAAQGAADTPAFRYTAYIVFKDYQLADVANHIPNITAEIVCSGTGTAPYQVASWNPLALNIPQAVSRDGILETVNYTRNGLVATYEMTRRNLAGTVLNIEAKTFTLSQSAAAIFVEVVGSPRLCYIQYQAMGKNEGTTDMAYENRLQPDLSPYQSDNFYSAIVPGPHAACAMAGYLFSRQSIIGGGAGLVGIARRTLNGDGTAQSEANKFLEIANVVSICAGDDGLLYVVFSSSPNIISYDINLTQIATYNYPGVYSAGNGITVRDGLLMDFEFIALMKCRLFTLSSPTLTFLAEINTNPSNGTDASSFSLGNGLVAHTTGVYSMYPSVTPSAITLASVVTNLCARCGLTAGQINVTALTDAIDFYAIGRHVAGRAGIEPLMQAYFFDAVESGATIKFVKRGGASQATFTENDLGFGEQSSALVKTSRQQEYELPIQVNIGHMDINNDYQPGTQNARRLISPSKVIVDLDFPMGFSSTKAAQIAEVLQLNAWTERTRYTMQATRKHAHLEPTDIITLPSGELARIVSSDLSDNGALKLEAVADAVAMYSPVAVGNDSGSNTPQDVPTAGPTLALIMDLPALESSGNAPGIYLAAAGYYSGWRGAEILVSADSGVSYDSVYAVTNDAVIGYTTTAFASVALVHQLDVYGAVTVQLINSAYTLSSITDDQVLAGGNLCAIRSGTAWELMQFGTATLVSAGVYTLSRFMRGRFGTESLTAGHVAGDAFVLITADELNFIARPQADVNVARLLKAATFSDTYADTPAEAFTSIGRSQQPLAPVHLGAAPSQIDYAWTLSWVRRARVNFWWLDVADMRLDEATESYRVGILNSAGAVVRTIDVTAATATYTAAQQFTDFGGHLSALSWQVCQRSALIGDGQYATRAELAPQFGNHLRVLLSHLPVILVYTWTSTTVVDDVGINNFDGTFVSTKNVNDADSGILSDAAIRSVEFTGGAAYATIPDNSSIDISGDMTAVSWIKPASFTVDQTPFAKWIVGATSFDISITTSGAVNFARSVGGSFHIVSAPAITTGAWHMLVGVRRGGLIEVYTNGVLRATTASVGLTDITTTALGIGARANGTQPVPTATRLGPQAIFNHALTAAQILALYNNAITR